MPRSATNNFYAHLQTAADFLSTSILVLDRFARICWCNSAAESLLGCSRRSLKGTDAGLFMPQVRQWVEKFSQKDAKYSPYSAVAELARPMAEPEPVHASISQIAGSDGLLLLEIAEVEKAMKLARQEQEAGMSDATRALLRNLAHEVKNPLGGIRGAAQLLESELSSPEQREYTEVIIAEADHNAERKVKIAQIYADGIVASAEQTAEKAKQQAQEYLDGIVQGIEAELSKPTPKRKRQAEEELSALRTENAALRQSKAIADRDRSDLFERLQKAERRGKGKETAFGMVSDMLAAYPDEFNALLNKSRAKNSAPSFKSNGNNRGGK